jgi:hypothetical protein
MDFNEGSIHILSEKILWEFSWEPCLLFLVEISVRLYGGPEDFSAAIDPCLWVLE